MLALDPADSDELMGELMGPVEVPEVGRGEGRDLARTLSEEVRAMGEGAGERLVRQRSHSFGSDSIGSIDSDDMEGLPPNPEFL